MTVRVKEKGRRDHDRSRAGLGQHNVEEQAEN